jgi:hypothetical protein
MVGLWVAALFGLGSFAVAPQMLEKLVTAMGLPAIVPATAPPLGFTARALLAMALTVLGAIFGLLIGRSLRPSQPVPARRRFNPGVSREVDLDAPKVRARDAHPDAPPRKPLTLSEDLVAAEDVAEPVLRRRSLAVPEEATMFDPVEGVPLPGHDPWYDADVATPAFGESAVTGQFYSPARHDSFVAEAVVEELYAPEVEYVEGDVVAEHAKPAFALYKETTESAFELESFLPTPEVEAETVSVTVTPPPFAAPLVAAGYRHVEAPAEPAPVLRSPVADVPLADLGLVQLIERLALAMVERRERQEALLAAADAVAPTPSISAEVAAVASSDLSIEVDAPVAAAPFEQLEAPATPRLPRVDDAILPPIEVESSERVVSLRRFGIANGAIGSGSANAVVSYDEWSGDDWENGEVAIPRFLSSSNAPPLTPQVQAAPDITSHDVDSDAPAEELYSSLLDIAQPTLRQEFVRIADVPEEENRPDVEPVVIFPGQGSRTGAPFDRPSTSGLNPVAGSAVRSGAGPAPTAPAAPSTLPNPDEADRALRAALATLQRMTAKG